MIKEAHSSSDNLNEYLPTILNSQEDILNAITAEISS
jgi:hypothetical protein